jgi:hypothetical protein
MTPRNVPFEKNQELSPPFNKRIPFVYLISLTIVNVYGHFKTVTPTQRLLLKANR